MSRKWTTKDEIQILKSNIQILKEKFEPALNKINIMLEDPLNIANIVDAYETKLDQLIKQGLLTDKLKKERISYLINEVNTGIKYIDRLSFYKPFINSKLGNKIINIYINKYNKSIEIINNY